MSNISISIKKKMKRLYEIYRNLASNRLEGSIPDSIGNLISLVSL